MIYFIQDLATFLIKIGWTDQRPEERLKQLQTGSSAELRLIYSIDGDRSDESGWHRDFERFRVRGEWFQPHADLLYAIIGAVGAIAFDCGSAHGYAMAEIDLSFGETDEDQPDCGLVRGLGGDCFA